MLQLLSHNAGEHDILIDGTYDDIPSVPDTIVWKTIPVPGIAEYRRRMATLPGTDEPFETIEFN